jgi:hypothetical protein
MKFQKDISDPSVAPSPSKHVEEEKKSVDGRNPEIVKRIKEDRKIIDRVAAGELLLRKVSPHNKSHPHHSRTSSYPPVVVQLDMLWHDIDSGKISANTTASGTWYQRIKIIKENNPLPK